MVIRGGTGEGDNISWNYYFFSRFVLKQLFFFIFFVESIREHCQETKTLQNLHLFDMIPLEGRFLLQNHLFYCIRAHTGRATICQSICFIAFGLTEGAHNLPKYLFYSICVDRGGAEAWEASSGDPGPRKNNNWVLNINFLNFATRIYRAYTMAHRPAPRRLLNRAG